jgi:hypothetical protein
MTEKLSGLQVHRLVHKFIGVEAGYLVGFTYAVHQRFYPLFCELDIDPLQRPGTTRDRFISILNEQEPKNQAKILRGVIAMFSDGNQLSKDSIAEMEKWIADLESVGVSSPSLVTTSEVVHLALRNAETLLCNHGPTSAVDRVHTAMHGFLRASCDAHRIQHADDAGMVQLMKQLVIHHPALQADGPRKDDIDKVLKSFSTVLDAMNPVRNQASVAHPNDNLLAEPEARLVLNAIKSILQYLEDKFSAHRQAQRQPPTA